MNEAPSSGEIPEIRKPDLQLLLQDLAQSKREVLEERRHGERKVAEEQDRIRKELLDRLGEAERMNDALVRTLGRLQSENDRLREQLALLKAECNRYMSDARRASASSHQDQHQTQPSTTFFKASRVVLVPPSDPLLGKPIPIDPQLTTPPTPPASPPCR